VHDKAFLPYTSVTNQLIDRSTDRLYNLRLDQTICTHGLDIISSKIALNAILKTAQIQQSKNHRVCELTIPCVSDGKLVCRGSVHSLDGKRPHLCCLN